MLQPAIPSTSYYGWRIVALLFFTLFFTAGYGFYTFAVYLPRFVETLKCDVFAITIAVALSAVMSGLASPVIGTLIQRTGVRKVLVASTAAVGLVAILMSFVDTLWHLYLLVAISGAVGAGSTLLPAQTAVTLWFRKYRGRAMALTLMGTGFGGLLLPPATAYLIEHFGWRVAYRVTGLAFFVIVLPPLIVFLKNRPSDVGQVSDGLPAGQDGGATSNKLVGVSMRRAIRSLPFWMIMGICVLQIYTMTVIMANTQIFAERQGFSMMMASLFMALALGITLPGRLAAGVLCDRFGPKPMMAVAGLFLAAGSLSLEVFVLKLGWIDFRAIAAFALLQGIAVALNAVVLPMLVARCFGEREFSKLMGVVMVGYSVGVILGPTSAARIFDKTGSYEIAFLICIAFSLLSAVLALLLRPDALHSQFETESESPTPSCVATESPA